MIAIISDVHGNLSALEAVLEKIHTMQCDRIISLGDVAGYYCNPGECIDLLIENDVLNIMGNHDYYIVKNESCPRSRLVTALTEFQRGVLKTSHVEWLAASLSHYIKDLNYYTHGGWENMLDQYLYSISEQDIPDDAKIFFTGHTHVQVLAEFKDKIYCNPGSVGQPRDGDSRAAFATLNSSGVELHRVKYDIDRTANAMRNAGFDGRFYENLYIGSQIGGRVDKVTIITGN